jgi:hypothetical protein
MDFVGTITHSTSMRDRRHFKDKMNEKGTPAYLNNLSILSKGFNVNDVGSIGISPSRLSSDSMMVHIPARGVRRRKGERGLPLEQCTKKKSVLHLGCVENDDGTLSDSARAVEIIKGQIKAQGILFKDQNYRWTPPTTKDILIIESENEKAQESRSATSDENLVGKIQVVETSKAVMDFRKKLELSALKNKSLEEVVEVFKNA